MSTALKTLGAALMFGMLSLYGCSHGDTTKVLCNNPKIVVSAFNDETYVWEGYQFTTNRVIEKK